MHSGFQIFLRCLYNSECDTNHQEEARTFSKIRCQSVKLCKFFRAVFEAVLGVYHVRQLASGLPQEKNVMSHASSTRHMINNTCVIEMHTILETIKTACAKFFHEFQHLIEFKNCWQQKSSKFSWNYDVFLDCQFKFNQFCHHSETQ